MGRRIDRGLDGGQIKRHPAGPPVSNLEQPLPSMSAFARITDPSRTSRHVRFDADSGSERQQKAAAGVEKIGDGFSLWA
jgi:hypothetical protein